MWDRERIKKNTRLLGTVGTLLTAALLVFLEVLYLQNALKNGDGASSTGRWQILLLGAALIVSWRVWTRFDDLSAVFGVTLCAFSAAATVLSALFVPADGIADVVRAVLWFSLFLAGYAAARYYPLPWLMPVVISAAVPILAFLFVHGMAVFLRGITAVYFLICCAPFVVALRWKIPKIALLALITMCVFLSMKRSAIIVWVLVLAFLAFSSLTQLKKLAKWYNIVILVLALGAGAAMIYWFIRRNVGDMGSIVATINAWKKRFGEDPSARELLVRETWAAFTASPWREKLLGHGYNAVMRNAVTLNGLSSHNDFLEILYNYGLVALAAFAAFAATLTVHAVRLFRRAHDTANGLIVALIVWLIASLPSHMLTYNTYFLLIALYLGYARGTKVPAASATEATNTVNEPQSEKAAESAETV